MTPLADYQGIALVLGATGGLLTVIVGTGLQVAMFIRQGRQLRDGVARDAKITQVHDLVNGQSERLNAALISVAKSEGEKIGAADEAKRHE
jgi:hypothetical protein